LQEKSPLNKYSHIALQGIVLVLLFSAMLCIKSKKHIALVVIVLVDLALAVQLNGPLNMYYNVPTAAIDAHLSKISNPSLTNQAAYTPLGVLSNKTIENTAGLWVNLNTFTRTTGLDGYNPFMKFGSVVQIPGSSEQFDVIHCLPLFVLRVRWSVGQNIARSAPCRHDENL
jgi:hypothetical protein